MRLKSRCRTMNTAPMAIDSKPMKIMQAQWLLALALLLAASAAVRADAKSKAATAVADLLRQRLLIHQIRLRWPALFLELLRVPATRDDQPGTRLLRQGGFVDSAHGLDERCCSNPIHFRRKRLACTDGMDMGIDQTRNDRATLQVDHTRPRARLLSHIRVAAYHCNFAIANSEGITT